MGCYYKSPQSFIIVFSIFLVKKLWGLKPLILIYRMGIFCIINVHYLIGHCLIPLDH